MTTVTENQIAFGILRIAASQKSGVSTFRRLYKEIPKYVSLSKADWQLSNTRNGEPMWHQIVRNVKSHYEQEGNFIECGYLTHVPRVGYAITKTGTAYLKSKGI